MTGKEKLKMILDGGIPDSPPHWELVFQIEKEMFGVDLDAVPKADRMAAQIDVYHRLVDEFGWAAVPGSYEPAELKQIKEALGHKALVPAYESSGVFSMPTGETMMDLAVRLYEDRQGLHAEARRRCDGAKQHCRHAVEVGADFFVLAYDFGYNEGPLSRPSISPIW